MKPMLKLLSLWLVVAIYCMLTSCATVTTETTSTAPDGTVTKVVTKSSTGDAATISATTNAAALVLPYLIAPQIRGTK